MILQAVGTVRGGWMLSLDRDLLSQTRIEMLLSLLNLPCSLQIPANRRRFLWMSYFFFKLGVCWNLWVVWLAHASVHILGWCIIRDLKKEQVNKYHGIEEENIIFKIMIVWSNLYIYILVCKIMHVFCVQPVSKGNYTIYLQMRTVS